MTRHYWMGGNRSHEQDRFFEASLDKAQWQRAKSAEDWQACWYTGMPGPEYFAKVGPERRINHIPGNNALTVKSRLYRSLMDLRDRVKRQEKGPGPLGERLDFVPHVYSMPEDYHRFQQAALDSPDKRWLLKPKNASKGKGIRLVEDPGEIPMDSSWMVQEYLENPHTMHGRKYVLRLYVLVSSVTPFRVYLYKQGFAKLASVAYNEENANNPYSYLTNPDINALNLEAEVPVEFVDFESYRLWLREQGHDDQALFEQIEDLVALTCLSAQEPMRERSRAIGADTRGCYELLGIDCLVDQDLKPWILECNLSPSLEVCAGPESGGRIEEMVKGGLVADMVGLLGLNLAPEDSPKGSSVQQVVRETQAELTRSGGFRNLIPGDDPARYLPYMALPRLADWVVAQALSDRPSQQPLLERWVAEEVVTEDQVLVYDTRLGHLSALNETASLIWLMATEGGGPDDIASTLVNSALKVMPDTPDAWAIRNNVWNTLGDWVNNRFLVQSREGPANFTIAEENRQLPVTWWSRVLQCGRTTLRVQADSIPLVSRLFALLEPLEVADEGSLDTLPRLDIVRDTPGFTLILDGQVIASRRPLAEVSDVLFACLMREAPGAGDIAIDAGVIMAPDPDGFAILVVPDKAGLTDGLANGLTNGLINRVAEHLNTASARGVLLGPDDLLRPLSIAGGQTTLPSVPALLIPAPASVDVTDGVCPVSVSDALQYLIPACCCSGGRSLDAASFARLVGWLESRERLLVDTNNLEAATVALWRTMKRGGHNDIARVER